jgi:PTS system mannose-specific IIA component
MDSRPILGYTASAMAENDERIGGVIVSHGQLATELLSAAETIVGEINHVVAVSIGWHDDVDMARQEVARSIERVDRGRGVLLLTDMFGGTPTNIAATFLGEDRAVEIITGVNLPMIISLADQTEGGDLAGIARRVRDQGQRDIYIASEVLAPKPKG